ncbi:hypothetical protein [Klebsiella aerogenes]|uniref:hypothetical protein n=1 Tax=Klebsiella aerogenes TaxID=548 RepID=UPI002DBE0886|nr:hypothetical protein [Klebsiella aerogenes]MEB7619102.1 helix-turn-helix domain-containing protein [Klebsiella aerogenes]
MKTTKSQKTQYRGEITMLEFLKVNPGLTAREIAKELDRSMCSVSGQLRQLHSAGRITQDGIRDGVAVWSINDMPFGCANQLRMKFDSLLKGCREMAQKQKTQFNAF